MEFEELKRVRTCITYYDYNYNKILKSDWLSTVLIWLMSMRWTVNLSL